MAETKKIADSRQGKRSEASLANPAKVIDNAIHVLILQHPQEPDKDLGTAALCVNSLQKAELKVGLSWRSLAKALGHEVPASEWGVLYLGGKSPKLATLEKSREVVAVDKKNNPLEKLPVLQGLVVLDGSWSQAKALWWRNPWLLKLRRIVLRPQNPSLYGKMRKEPRRECLSTIESVGLALAALSGRTAISEVLRDNFQQFLNGIRSAAADKQGRSSERS